MAKRVKKNPFDPAQEAVETFVGRKSVLRQLAAGLQEGKSYALTGARRIGKTSLLKAIEHRIVAGTHWRKRSPLPLPVYVECRREHDRVETILACIVSAATDALSTQYGWICPHKVRGKAHTAAEEGRLDVGWESISTWVFEHEQRTCRMILLLDALHRIDGKPFLADLPVKLHPLVDKEKRMAVLLVGRRDIAPELRNDVSPLPLTRHFQLQPLTLAETRALVRMAANHGWNVAKGSARKAYRLTGGHPYRLQYYLQAALEEAGELSENALQAIQTSETLKHLDGALTDGDSSAADPATVFVSYSHKDESEKEQLMTHLGVLGSAGRIDPWCDDRTGAGGDWEAEIRRAIEGAKVSVLLVTANFLTSKFILGQEVPQILQRRHQGGLHVFPVIARDCAWQQHKWLAAMNVRPKNGLPVWREEGRHADRELTAIANEIAAI